MRQVLRGAVLACLAGALSAAAPPRGDEKLTLSKEEQRLLDLTNQERARKKLPALKPNPVLFRVARAHSANMAKQRKMAHVLDGKKPPQRVEAAGYRLGWVGENIAVSGDLEPDEVMKDWMGSKLHRENILNPRYTEIGIGLAKNSKGEWYYTQVFARPRR